MNGRSKERVVGSTVGPPPPPDLRPNMNPDRRESVRLALRTLAESHAATLRLMEETYALLADELALDPLDFLARHLPPAGGPSANENRPVLDDARLTVVFRGRTCHLGNTLPFRLLTRLAPGRAATSPTTTYSPTFGTGRSDLTASSAAPSRSSARSSATPAWTSWPTPSTGPPPADTPSGSGRSWVRLPTAITPRPPAPPHRAAA